MLNTVIVRAIAQVFGSGRIAVVPEATRQETCIELTAVTVD